MRDYREAESAYDRKVDTYYSRKESYERNKDKFKERVTLFIQLLKYFSDSKNRKTYHREKQIQEGTGKDQQSNFPRNSKGRNLPQNNPGKYFLHCWNKSETHGAHCI